MKLHLWLPKAKSPLCSALPVALFIVIVGLVVWTNYLVQETLLGAMANKDFMSLWIGGKAIVLGLNPYDVDVWRPLRAAYGSSWMPNPISPFPLYTHVLFIPLSFLHVDVAGALWMTIGEISIILGISWIVKTQGWENRSIIFTLLFGAFLSRPIFPAIMNGQLSPVLFVFLVAAYMAYEKGYPFTAGLVLSLEVIKPNVTAVLLSAVGVIFLLRRDWRALLGMMTGGLLILGVSWAVMPGWISQWWAITQTSKGHIAFMNPTIWGLVYELGGEHLWPGSGIVTVGLYLALLFFLWKQRARDWLVGLGAAVIASVSLAPYLWAYEHVILFLPNIIALHWGLTSQRGNRWAWWAGWWFVNSVLGWLLLFVAYRRGVDTWSALVPLASLGYLLLAWRARETGLPDAAIAGIPGITR